MAIDARQMLDKDIIEELRRAASHWFKNDDLLLLEELIRRYMRSQRDNSKRSIHIGPILREDVGGLDHYFCSYCQASVSYEEWIRHQSAWTVTDEMIAAAWNVILKHRIELMYQPGKKIQTEIYCAMRALEP